MTSQRATLPAPAAAALALVPPFGSAGHLSYAACTLVPLLALTVVPALVLRARRSDRSAA